MPRTRICEDLGIEHPILSVGFAAAAGPELVAAVSNAGGLGVLGGGAKYPPEYMREQIARTRELTGRPFGVNLIIDDQGNPESTALIHERYAAVVEQRVPLVVLFEGDPASFVEPAHANGVKAFGPGILPRGKPLTAVSSFAAPH